ncbi:MAG: tetratricopeptide repeat protein [Candidatus Krumholzibacteria bacterium]|nr:tetratricopeptide repeat protein [Candidatus Krumholzibacteria bacterium]
MIRQRMGFYLMVSIVVFLGAACASKKTGPMEMGMQSFEAQDYEGAKTHFETALTTEPENPQAVYYLGRIALEAGDIDQAVERLEKAVTLDEAQSDYHFYLGVAYAQKIQKVSFFEKGQLAPKLKGEFEKAVETDPANVQARMGLAQYYLNAPPIAGGSKEKAMEQVEAIKKLDPKQGHLFTAQIHMAAKEHDKAEKEMKAALALDPTDTDVHYQMGMLYQTKKDYPAAFAALEKAIEIDPMYMSAMYQMGRTAIFAEDNYDRGIECLKIYLNSKPQAGQPTWAHAHWRLGMVYEKMGNVEMAKKEYQAALDLDPDLKDAKEALEKL